SVFALLQGPGEKHNRHSSPILCDDAVVAGHRKIQRQDTWPDPSRADALRKPRPVEGTSFRQSADQETWMEADCAHRAGHARDVLLLARPEWTSTAKQGDRSGDSSGLSWLIRSSVIQPCGSPIARKPRSNLNNAVASCA